jgi:hypothetical protein
MAFKGPAAALDISTNLRVLDEADVRILLDTARSSGDSGDGSTAGL